MAACLGLLLLVLSLVGASDIASVLSVASCSDILSFERAEQFATLPLDYPTFKQWPSLEPIQKTVYLVDGSYIRNLKQEFIRLLESESGGSPLTINHVESSDAEDPVLTQGSGVFKVPMEDFSSDHAVSKVSFNTLVSEWSDFVSPRALESLFRECDRDLDRSLDWIEYLLCRAMYTQHGTPYDVSELDYLENIVLYDFQRRLMDPNDPMTQELLARDEL